MPAQSKAQRRFFALALQYKKGELKSSEVSDEFVFFVSEFRELGERKRDGLE